MKKTGPIGRRAAAWAAAAFACAGAQGQSFDAGLFAAEVLPILASKCFACHGPDGAERKAGLRLDDHDAIRAELPSGARAVVPGDPDASALIRRIESADPAHRMPPPEFPKPLNDAERATLRRWIEAGAPWQGHWAFAPLRAPAPPPVERPGWGRNPIDAFILAEQEKRGLAPSPEADRRTLIRRLSYDLIGLPPTPEETQAFLNDSGPEAYEALADRLLASPRYGERWARHWLDVARYADTHGYDKDKRRPNAWPYRDYVIASLNADKPYGRFVEEQLAGDALYPGDPAATAALGFIAAGPWDFVGHVELREGTVDKAITRNLDRDDMAAGAMNVFAGLTVQCARCHDHKFDPIGIDDYYSLQAVFAGVDRADRPFDRDPAIHRKRHELTRDRDGILPDIEALRAAMEAAPSPERDALDLRIAALRDEVKARASADSPGNGYHSAIEKTPDAEKWVRIDLGSVRTIDRLRLIAARPTDFPDTPGFGFPVRFKIEASADDTFSAPALLADHTAEDSPARTDAPFTLAFPPLDARYVRITATRLWERIDDYVFALAEAEIYSGDENAARGAAVTAGDSIEAGRWSRAFLVDGFDSRRRIGGGSDDAVAGLRAELSEREAERARIARGLLPEGESKRLAALEEGLAEADRALAALPEPSYVYAAAASYKGEGAFNPPGGPREVRVLNRGDVNQPGEAAQPGSVGCLPSLPSRFELADPKDEAARRAALAKWLSDERNPLTWRSVVNRVWHYHFGRGIVDTPNDFGRMGSPPAHPELLDWLASAFLENGQSLKWLHRQIVTSAVYRQVSLHNAAFAEIDGDNRYLWRMNRRQLEAEAVYDSVLAVSGKLDYTMGGPGYDAFAFEDDHSPRYLYAQHDPEDPAAFRRSVYRFVVRSVPDPFMTCLDAADPSQSVPVRGQTLTALQALATLNNPMMVRQAAFFTERIEATADAPEERIRTAYRLALCREPADDEAAALSEYAERHGLAAACRLLFNTNEFLFVD